MDRLMSQPRRILDIRELPRHSPTPTSELLFGLWDKIPF